MSSVTWEMDRNVPVIAEADVVVIGGGPGGLGAAVMSARAGAGTLLVERYGYLGGMASSGEVHPFMNNHNESVSMDAPVYQDWITAMRTYAVAPGLTEKEIENASGKALRIHKDAAMLAAEDLCLEAGVKLLYHHALAGVTLKDGAIEAAILFSKSGFVAVKAKQFVDCSGDGDLAARAGCEFEVGGPTGACQPMTLCFKLRNVDRSRTPERSTINELYNQAKEAGEIDCPRENCLWFLWLDDDVIHFNTTRVIHKSGVNGVELSEAEIEARRQLRQYLKFFRDRVPGFERAEIHSIAHHIGVRETRRIKGLNFITREDFARAAKYPDGIARVNYPIDIHNPDGKGTEITRVPPGDWYEIPYGCLVAKDVSNLTIGGRPISVDHAVHSSMRVMPPACSVGQAAGLASAMAAAQGVSPKELDGAKLRQELINRGARL